MAVDDSFTKILLHMDGADASTTFTDESGKTWTTNGNAQIDTAQSKFGGASGLFDGTGDYVDAPDHADFDVGSGDFTIDCWIRTASTAAQQFVCGQSDSAGTSTERSWDIQVGADAIIYVQLWGSGTTIGANSNSAISTNTWYHIAAVRNGNTLTLYLNGVAQTVTGNTTGITANNSSSKAAIGKDGERAGTWNGWIDEFRFSKGVARWTANFTPPTSPYGQNSNFFMFF